MNNRYWKMPVAQGPVFPARTGGMIFQYDGSQYWCRTPDNPTDESFKSVNSAYRPVVSPGVPFGNVNYRRMIYGVKKPEGIYDPRGKHNRLYNNEIVNLSGYEGYDYQNPYLINAARYAALTLSPRKPPYQLTNSTPQAVAMNVMASRSVWRKWGVR